MQDPFRNKPLSFGQVVYAISGSSRASPVLIDQLRYLRRLGVPFSKSESQGSGNRMTYTFDHLFECGLAVMALDFLKPQEISQIIVNHRVALRQVGRKTLASLSKQWASVLERYDGEGAHRDDSHIVLRDRYDPKPCTFSLMGPIDSKRGALAMHSIHRLPQAPRLTGRHLPLKSLVATLVFRGMQAPETKPGPQ